VPELAVVIPTFNERENLPVLIDRLHRTLLGISYEIVIVDDDSPDGTAALAREIAERDSHVRIIHRIHRRGLASACIEGMLATSAPCIAVMDADLQHDETILPAMLNRLRSEAVDLVVGTRHADGGSMGQFARRRVALSQAGRWMSRLVCRTSLTDPMSGFFMLTRTYLDEVVHSLSNSGFKILLDLIASSARPVRIAEVGYSFGKRLHGESKLDVLVGLEYFQLLADKFLVGLVPVTYIVFAAVGSIGVVGHLALVSVLLTFGVSFFAAQMAGSLVVIALNFFLNNLLTFRSMRLRGRRLITGLLLFYAACLVGLLANLQFAEAFREVGAPWHLAALAGILLGSVWNYWISSIFIWRVNRRWRPRTRLQAESITSRGAFGAQA
jgi:dolichol-phosphate mannosyltransferase